MAKDYVVEIGYYFWLIPSIFSCLLSTILLGLRLWYVKDIKWVNFLQILFAIADILQCIPWFFGSIYSTTEDRVNSKLCIFQEQMFKFGIMTKCLLSSIAISVLAYYAISKKTLRIDKVLPPSMVIVIYTMASYGVGVALNSDAVACRNLHDYNIKHLRNDELVYVLSFLLPIFVFCFVNFLSFLATFYYSSVKDTSIISAMMTPHIDRVGIFTLIAWIAYTPALLFFMFFLFHQVNIPLYCLTGFLVSSTGTLGSGYLILAPWIDKTRRVNLFFYIEKMLEDNEEADGVKLSEISVSTTTPLT